VGNAKDLRKSDSAPRCTSESMVGGTCSVSVCMTDGGSLVQVSKAAHLLPV